jgi:hypothetical protein
MKKITTFWNWFQKNEQEIINAFFLGINGDEIYSQFDKRLCNISRRIGFEIRKSNSKQCQCSILFTAYGYRKLFPKIMALENQAPQLAFFTVEGFIKPFENVEKFKNGTDDPTHYGSYSFKISELQMALLEYNVATKQIKIKVYVPHYNEIKHNADLEHNIHWIVMQVIGEVTYRKHIKEIHLHPMPLEPKGLLSLIALPDFIDYLYQINSRKKTRML